jgi:hypothetical protein
LNIASRIVWIGRRDWLLLRRWDGAAAVIASLDRYGTLNANPPRHPTSRPETATDAAINHDHQRQAAPSPLANDPSKIRNDRG